jgi:hypothetical protein
LTTLHADRERHPEEVFKDHAPVWFAFRQFVVEHRHLRWRKMNLAQSLWASDQFGPVAEICGKSFFDLFVVE